MPYGENDNQDQTRLRGGTVAAVGATVGLFRKINLDRSAIKNPGTTRSKRTAISGAI
jgi:hypothetical protein